MFPSMRTVIVLQDLEFGGCQRQALLLASGLDRRFGAELWVMCTSEGGFWPEAASLPVQVRVLADSPTVGLMNLYGLFREMRARPVDVIMPMTAVPNIWCRVFSRLAGSPAIVGTCRSGDSIESQHESFLKGLACQHICNSRPLAERLVREHGLSQDRVSVIENGVIPREGADHADREPVILCVARYVPIKELHVLIRAFALVADDAPEAQLHLVGEGPLEGKLRELAHALGVGERVRFLSPRGDVGVYYDQAAVFALSSRAEGTPNVLLEAGAAGLPSVATRVGGIPDVIEDGRTGLLVPPGSPEHMAEGLRVLLASSDTRRDMGMAARERVLGRYGLEAMVRRYEQVFDAL